MLGRLDFYANSVQTPCLATVCGLGGMGAVGVIQGGSVMVNMAAQGKAHPGIESIQVIDFI